MKYYAHTKTYGEDVAPEEEWQPLKVHLENVAHLSEAIVVDKFRSMAYLCGLTHDAGKYQLSFQRRLRGNLQPVDHSSAGAKEVYALFNLNSENVASFVSGYIQALSRDDERELCARAAMKFALPNLFAYVVSGHHTGLLDYGWDEKEDSLKARLKKSFEPLDGFKEEVCLSDEKLTIAMKEFYDFTVSCGENVFAGYELLVRYLFSCLVDADYLDTESFLSGNIRVEHDGELKGCEILLNEKFASFGVSPLSCARNSIREEALKNASNGKGMYLLDAPTGSGKTLLSVSIALSRARAGNKKRIIYVIPYTSVTEQTAGVLRGIFPGVPILEHHSCFDFDSDDASKRYAERWDAPIIVTTNVQFFESIFSRRPAKLRKLHNMAESVIVFDEIHAMPLECFAPCMEAAIELYEHLGAEEIFLSATMPSIEKLTEKILGRSIGTVDLVPDKSLYKEFSRVRLEDAGEADVVAALSPGKSSLVVCNNKKTVLKFYEQYEGEYKHCLSTYMTPNDRFRVTNLVRSELDNGKKPKLFSTSLIEAGVDLDFDEAWREMAGLDNILQTAGRCNREGKRKVEESVVRIFETGEETSPEIARKAAVTKEKISKYGAGNLFSSECVEEYFKTLYLLEEGDVMKGKNLLNTGYDADFKNKAEKFRYISGWYEAVVIPVESISEDIEALKRGERTDRRKFQRHTCCVTSHELQKLVSSGKVAVFDGVNILVDMSLYKEDTGLEVLGE